MPPKAKTKKEDIQQFDVELPPHMPTLAGFYETETQQEYICIYSVRMQLLQIIMNYYQTDGNIPGADADKILSDAKKYEQYIISNKT